MKTKLSGHVIGIDAGGTKIKVALSIHGEIAESVEFPTYANKGGSQCFARIVIETKRLIHHHACSIDAIGLASPGVVHPVAKTTHLTWNIPGWDNLDVVKQLEQTFQVPVTIENDANMAAIGEFHYGSHGNSLAFFAIGTGFGAGLVLNGAIWQGKSGAAGEIAKWLMAPEAVRQTFNYGHLESLMSGSGFEARYHALTGHTVTGKQIFDRMHHGDNVAHDVLEDGATVLAMAAANVSNLLDLDAIVLGGGVMMGGADFWLPYVESIVAEWCIYPPRISLSVLGENAVLMGAMVQAYRVISGGASQ